MRSVEYDGSMWTVEELPGGSKMVPTDASGGPTGRPIKLLVFREEGASGAEHVAQIDRETTLESLSDEELAELLERQKEEDAREY